jgi:hypothetical protein
MPNLNSSLLPTMTQKDLREESWQRTVERENEEEQQDVYEDRVDLQELFYELNSDSFLYDFDGIPYDDDGLTNFRPDQRPAYEEAIRRSGATYLYIGEEITKYGWPASKYECALRINGPRHDLSEFWRIFEEVEKEMRENCADTAASTKL